MFDWADKTQTELVTHAAPTGVMSLRQFLGAAAGIATPGAVRMYRIGDWLWEVRGPSGEIINTTGTTTQGLQEAINYAVAHGYDLHVSGGVVTTTGGNFDPAVITCSTTVFIPPVQKCVMRFDAVSLLVTAAVGSSPGLHFNSFMMLTFDFSGQVIYEGNGAAVKFEASGVLPDGFPAQVDSRIRIHTVAYVAGGGDSDSACIKITGAAAPSHCRFEFGEINGSGYDWNTQQVTIIAKRGISVDNCPFEQNIIDVGRVHHVSNVGVQVGTSVSGARPARNSWRIGAIQPAGSANGFDTFANNEFIDLAVNNDSGGVVNGVYFQASAINNTVIAREMRGCQGTQVIDLSPDKSNMVLTGSFSYGRAFQKSAFGYYRTDDGLLIQWGAANAAPGGQINAFPIAFAEACYQVTLGCRDAFAETGVTINSTSHFTVHCNAGTPNVNWMAVGR